MGIRTSNKRPMDSVRMFSLQKRSNQICKEYKMDINKNRETIFTNR